MPGYEVFQEPGQTFVNAPNLVPAVVTIDAALNDSDKAVAVPASTRWALDAVMVELITTATAGNRQIRLQIRDGSANVLYEVTAPAVQAASLTVDYAFAPGLPRVAQIADDLQSAPLPSVVLEATYDVRVFDSAAIAVAADDLTIRVLARQVSV